MPDPNNPKTWTPDYAWKLIDQVLLRAKLSEIAHEMQLKVASAKSLAQSESNKRGNAGFYPHERIRNEEALADEWAEKQYQAALQTWETQGYKPCRPFFQAVYSNLLVHLFAARKGAVSSDLLETDKRVGQAGRSTAAAREFSRAITKLNSKWNTKMEVAAREYEYAEQRRQKAIAEAKKPSPATETHITTGIIEAPGLTIYGINPDSNQYLVQDRATGAYVFKPTRDSAIFDDRVIPIGSVQELLHRPKKGPAVATPNPAQEPERHHKPLASPKKTSKVSHLEQLRRSIIFGAIQANLVSRRYCAELDQKRLPVPDEWRAEGFPGSYVEAYKDRNGQWRKRIQDQKSRYQRKYDQTAPAERERLIQQVPTRRTRQ